MPSVLSSQKIVFTQLNNRLSTLVVIDASVHDSQALVRDIAGKAHILLLDDKRDGVEQITLALRKYSTVTNLHVVSHGGPGCLQLGSTQLTLENFAEYKEHLRGWADVLHGQNILLYGCQVAKGAIGYLFLQQLHQFTGANIAASSDRVGRIGTEQNWTLETAIGNVQTQPIFSPSLQQRYAGHFETVTFSTNTDTLVENEGTTYTFNFNIDGPIPEGGSVVRLEGSIPQAINEWNLFALNIGGIPGGLDQGIIDVSPALDFSAFNIILTEPNAFISLPVFNDAVDDSPQTITWSVTPVSAGTVVNNGSSTVTIYDDRSEVPVTPVDPPTPPTTGNATSEALAQIGGFDENFYLSTYPDIAASGIDPLTHFVSFGAREGRSPKQLFDMPFYLSTYPDVANAVATGALENALVHYVQSGVSESRDPSVYFDTSDYLLNNPDVAQAGLNPLGHYLQFGGLEGRDPNAVFDSDFYLSTYPDVAAAGLNPLEHYVQFGSSEGRSASATFNPNSYLAANADVANAGIEALSHYLAFGIAEGRAVA